jgi:polysaccharide chain length determinant protein (PEP-CTERM system associated)
LILALAGAGMAISLPAIYRSTATILIEEQDIPQDFVTTTVTSYAEERMQQINQRIMSYSRLVEIIDQFGLYPELKKKWTTGKIIAKMKQDTILNPVSARITDPRTGRPSTATISFTLSYQGKDPTVAQQVAHKLTSLFLTENIQVRQRQARGTIKFLEGEMTKISNTVKEQEARLTEFKLAHLNELPEMLQVNLRSLDESKGNIEIANERLSSLQERAGFLTLQLAGVKPHIEKEEELAVRIRLEELRVQLVALENRFSDQYPDVRNTRAEIARLEKQLSQIDAALSQKKAGLPDNPAYITLKAQLSSTTMEIGLLRKKIKELELSVAEYNRRIAATLQVEGKYLSLIGERDNTKAKYDDLMRKRMEAQVAQGLEKEERGERFTLVEPPRVPEKPFKPNRRAIVMIGLVLGISVGVGWASLREFLDDAVHKSDRLTLTTGFPVLADIPEIITPRDRFRKRIKRIALATCAAGVIAGGLAAVHFLVVDLDSVWAQVAERLGLEVGDQKSEGGG